MVRPGDRSREGHVAKLTSPITPVLPLPRRARLAPLALALGVACAASAPPFRRDTRVGAERRLRTADPALSSYFAAVYGHQRALADVARRRLDHLAALADALGLTENADRDAIAQAVRDALRAAGTLRIRVEVDPSDDARVDAWVASLTDASGDESAMRARIEARYLAVREGVQVRFTPAPPTAMAQVFAAITAVFREAMATRQCMERLTTSTSAPLQQGAALFAAHRELAAEFAAAETAVLGFHVRAARFAVGGVRLAQWMEDALHNAEAPAPEGDAGAAGDGGQ